VTSQEYVDGLARFERFYKELMSLSEELKTYERIELGMKDANSNDSNCDQVQRTFGSEKDS
jgi:hypothetical protein